MFREHRPQTPKREAAEWLLGTLLGGAQSVKPLFRRLHRDLERELSKLVSAMCCSRAAAAAGAMRTTPPPPVKFPGLPRPVSRAKSGTLFWS